MARIRSAEGTNLDAFSPADWARFLGLSLVWGSSFILIAFGLEAFPPGPVTWLRIGLGAATLVVVPRARRPVGREAWARLGVLSFTWVAIPFTLFPLAQQHIDSALAGMLNGATPIAAGLVAWWMLGRRPGRLQLVGLALGIVGIVMMGVPSLDGSSEALGVVLVVTAALFYGLSINLAVPLVQEFGSLPVMSRLLLLATVWTTPFGLVGWGSASFAWVPAVAVGILGVVCTGIAFALMASLTGSVGSTRASFITYVIPVVALVLGVGVRGDTVAPLAVAGVVAVIAGSLLASRADRS